MALTEEEIVECCYYNGSIKNNDTGEIFTILALSSIDADIENQDTRKRQYESFDILSKKYTLIGELIK